MTSERRNSAIAPIDEAVYLLDKFAPQTLAKLRQELPELGPHLISGGIAGPADALVIARAKVCATTLQEIDRLSERGIENAQRRLQRQKTLTLVGGITATFASASVVASLSASYPGMALVGGVVSLIGSLAALLSEHFGKIPRTDMSLFDAYRQLVDVRADARLLLSDINAFLQVGAQEEHEHEIAALVGKGETSFRKVHELLTALEIAST